MQPPTDETRRPPALAALLAAAGIAAAAALPATASAEPGDVVAGVEAGVGSMLSGYQRDTLNYGLDIHGTVRAGVALVEPLVLHATLASWWFPSSDGYGRASLLGVGVRWEPMVGAKGRLFIDGDGGLAFTGGLKRFMFAAGLGFEFDFAPSVGIGPLLRYGQVSTSSTDVPTDAKFWSIGLSVTWRSVAPPPPPPPPPPAASPAPPPPAPVRPNKPADADGDGIADNDDACPKEAAGDHPDKNQSRLGCPVGDVDLDKVYDDVDQCPTSAAGLSPDPDRPGCPDGDDDNDGVHNHEDKCRTQHKGYQPDPERKGCPLPDRDNDSVPDASDACPDKPGAPNADRKRNGCPGLVLVELGRIKINKPVFFATNKDTILKTSFPLLKAVADALRATPEIRKVSVEGHTDGSGSWDKNLGLSQRRAGSVRAWLIKNGIDEPRLESQGFGDSKPLASNKTAKGRATNRRVEFIVTDPAAPATSP